MAGGVVLAARILQESIIPRLFLIHVGGIWFAFHKETKMFGQIDYTQYDKQNARPRNYTHTLQSAYINGI